MIREGVAQLTITILDGPLGTELLARGVETPLPWWSARALTTAPKTVAQIHREYGAAGAHIHTANSFRTKSRVFPADWVSLTKLAVALAREGASGSQKVAGSISPLEDCYEPALSPADPRPEHRAMAQCLAEAGVDLMLVETFPHIGEALIACEEAVATGLETWVSFTAGPDADLLTPAEVGDGARQAAALGAKAVLVKCVPALRTLEFLEPLATAGIAFGAFANAGSVDDAMGWKPDALAASRYADLAQEWVDAGATILGSCCGTGVEHVRELARRFAPSA